MMEESMTDGIAKEGFNEWLAEMPHFLPALDETGIVYPFNGATPFLRIGTRLIAIYPMQFPSLCLDWYMTSIKERPRMIGRF